MGLAISLPAQAYYSWIKACTKIGHFKKRNQSSSTRKVDSPPKSTAASTRASSSRPGHAGWWRLPGVSMPRCRFRRGLGPIRAPGGLCIWRRRSHNHRTRGCTIGPSPRYVASKRPLRCRLRGDDTPTAPIPVWDDVDKYGANSVLPRKQYALKQRVPDRRLEHEYNQIGRNARDSCRHYGASQSFNSARQ